MIKSFSAYLFAFAMCVAVDAVKAQLNDPELTGQVMHFSFDHASGAIVSDSHMPERVARLYEGAEIGSNGVCGNALLLNGTSAFARLSQNPTTSDVYTVSIWFRASGEGLSSIQGATLFSYNRRYQIGFQRSGQNVLMYSYALNVPDFGYGAFEARSDPFPLVPERWFHVAMVLDGGISFYLDGRMIGTLSGRGSNKGGTEVLIGALNNGAGPRHFWSGAIDELRIFDRALTADEILAVMALDSPQRAADRRAPAYRLRDGRMFISELRHGRDVERPVTASEMRQLVSRFAPPVAPPPVDIPAASHPSTTVIGLSSAWDGSKDQNLFGRHDAVHIVVQDADYGMSTNLMMSALLWQDTPGNDDGFGQSVMMTNDVSGAWRGVISCEPFQPGEAKLVIAGMDNTGRPVLMRSSSLYITN